VADFDKERIDSLLHELLSWDRSGAPLCLSQLARRHRLDPMIVKRIAQAEDIDLSDEDATPELVDPDTDTGPIELD